MEQSRAYWLAIESKYNWKKDHDNSFQFTGVAPYREGTASKVKKGDFIIIYIPTPKKAFSDIRIAVEDGVRKSKHTMEYDIPCNTGIYTNPHIILSEEEWVPIQKILGRLEFVGSPPKSYYMRKSFRKLSESDGKTIASAITKAKRATASE